MPSTRNQHKQRQELRERQDRQETKQERILRAVQMVAISGFVEGNRDLQESGLAICNSCREYIPLPYVRIDRQVPSTLLDLFRPDHLCAEGEGSSRVLPPQRVLKVDWRFNDPNTPGDDRYSWGNEGADEEQEEDEEEEEGKWEDLDEQEEEGEDEEEEEEEEEDEEDDEDEEMELEGVEEAKGEKKQGKRGEKEGEKNVNSDLVHACNMDMSKVQWPEGVKEISLWGFNRRIEGVVWPDGLEVLSFHMPPPKSGQIEHPYGIMGNFDTSLNGATFPAGLRVISLGVKFDQPIDAVVWPEGLQRLSMPGFDQPIDHVQWPSGLKTLEFMNPYELEVQESPAEEVHWDRQDGIFDQHLDSFLPKSLETLWLSNCFDRPLDGVAWPSELAVLGLGTWVSSDSLDGVEWPPSLRKLVVAETFEPGDDVSPDCEVVHVQQRDAPEYADNTIGMHESQKGNDADGINYFSSDDDFDL